MTTVYGIPNCDTVKKARAWLDANGAAAHRFVDFRKVGVDPARLDAWIAALGWEALLNRRGTTFRGLANADKAHLEPHRARALMLAHPSLIRRPVIEHRGALLVGFDAGRYAAAFTGAPA